MITNVCIDSMIGRSTRPNQTKTTFSHVHVVSRTAEKQAKYAARNPSKKKIGTLNVLRSVPKDVQDVNIAGCDGEKDFLGSEGQQDWSTLLKNSTAIIRDSINGKTAYILGVSHVSKESCRLIEELIEKVQPDAVMLELCHERTGLLIDEQAASTGKNAWFSDTVDIIGLEENFEYKEDLLKMLRTYGGGPVSTQGIQGDADVLLATGLFESVTPITAPPAESGWDPVFVYVKNTKNVIPGIQLGSIHFKVVPRSLPRIDRISRVIFEDIGDFKKEDILDLIEKSILVDSGVPNESSVDALLHVKKEIVKHTSGKHDVMYQFDVESDSSMQVVARIVKSQGRFATSFEGTVHEDGTGIGIQRRGNAPFMGFKSASQVSSPITAITPWNENDKHRNRTQGHTSGETGKVGVLESLANMVTQTYGKYQADAGRRVGILPGEAWRVAFEAAARCKSRYIFLGDRSASVTSKRLLKAMISSSLPLFGVGALVSSATWMTSSLLFNAPSSLPLTLITAIISFSAASWPLVSPIQEIKAFSELSAKEIEDAVRVNEPLQSKNTTDPLYLWGEDALIRWPGAEEPVIRERDEYMSRAIYGMLHNIPCDLTPAYVATSEEQHNGATIYSYVMPKGASNIVCPIGSGQGQYDPMAGSGNPVPKTIVAVVGTAHVRGMIQHFNKGFVEDDTLERLSS